MLIASFNWGDSADVMAIALFINMGLVPAASLLGASYSQGFVKRTSAFFVGVMTVIPTFIFAVWLLNDMFLRGGEKNPFIWKAVLTVLYVLICSGVAFWTAYSMRRNASSLPTPKSTSPTQ